MITSGWLCNLNFYRVHPPFTAICILISMPTDQLSWWKQNNSPGSKNPQSESGESIRSSWNEMDFDFLLNNMNCNLPLQSCDTTCLMQLLTNSVKWLWIWLRVCFSFSTVNKEMDRNIITDIWPWTTKLVISICIFVAIAKNTLYGSKRSMFILCQK